MYASNTKVLHKNEYASYSKELITDTSSERFHPDKDRIMLLVIVKN